MVRVGVIGLGSMGKNHVRVYSEIPGVEIVGVADTDFGRAQEIGEQYHAAPFSDYEDMLKLGIDAVSIVVPTTLHEQVALKVARAKVHMLIEKPVAHNVVSAKEIIKVCRDQHIKLMVGHIERFNPVLPVLKKAIEGSQVSLIEITRIGPFPPRIQDVGVVKDLATHDIDLMRYITGSECKRIYGLTSSCMARYEDTAILILEMLNGSLGRITVNWLTPFKVREISIATKEKLIKASLIDQKVTEYSRYDTNGSDSFLVKELKVPAGEPLKAELKAFIRCISDDTPPPITGEDGLKVLEVINQAELCSRAKTEFPWNSVPEVAHTMARLR
jgi:UDP-N-acetylglucosamine 3-dehydrogenase